MKAAKAKAAKATKAKSPAARLRAAGRKDDAAARTANKPAKPVSLKDALTPLVGPAGTAKWQPVLTATESPRRFVSDIKVANRFRKDKGDIAALARSIDARGALLEPIVITPDGTLVDGERRILAWEKSKVGGYGKEPIPVSVVDIDSIIAGEYDANEQREPFKPSELVAIKRAIEDKLAAGAKARQGHGLTAPGRKKAGEVEGRGRTSDKVGAAAGVSGRTIEKATAVVEAAERDPERFGKLADDMDRTGKVDGAHKRLKIMEATDRLRASPPPLPGNGPYIAGTIDFPWPHESDDDQESIDARGRSLRPYPAMAIDAGEIFMRDQVAPLFGPDATLGFWTTNHHLVNGSAHRLIAALGDDWRASTMQTWGKDKIGRGQVLRDKSEQCILVHRGKPVINVLGDDPPSTLLLAPRRDNSQKPDEFYRQFERVFPAPRYAAIFSTGGEGELWDGHGDQVDKHALAAEAEPAGPRSLLDQLAMVKAAESGRLSESERGGLITAKLAKGKKGKALQLTRRGEDDLVALTEDRAQNQALAALPADFDGLAATYRETLGQLDAAARGADEDAVEHLIERLDLIEARASSLKGEDETPYFAIRRMVAAAAAPMGEVPGWGQRGMFRVDIDGVPYIVSFAGRAMCDFEVYAEDAAKPFLAESGFHAFYGDARPALGHSVAGQAEATIREELDGWDGAKPPSRVYRLPATWADVNPDDGGPVEVPRAAPPPAAAPSPTKAKRGRKPAAQLDFESAIGAADPDRALREHLARDQALAVESLADLAPSEEAALAARAVAAGHTMRMTLDHGTTERVATCACGAFEHRVAGGPDPDQVRTGEQDTAIAAHWRAVLGEMPTADTPPWSEDADLRPRAVINDELTVAAQETSQVETSQVEASP